MYEILAAELAGRRGMLGVASENYLSASKKTNDVRVAERATKLAIFSRNWEQAQQASERWSELEPENLEARQILAQIYLNQGDVSGATGALKGLISYSEDAGKGALSAVSTLLHDTNFRAALDVMRNLRDAHPNDAMIEFGLARLLLSNNEKTQSLESIERSLRLNSHSTDAILLKGQILSDLGRAQEGYAFIRAQFTESAGILVLRLGFTRMLVEGEQYDEASREFEAIAELAPKNANALFSLGLLALESRRTDAAEKYLKQVVDLGEYLSDSHYYLGRIAGTRQEHRTAISHYEFVAEGDNAVDARIRSAEIYAKIGQVDKGRERLQALRRVNTDPDIRIRLTLAEGRMLRQSDDDKASIEVFSQGLEEFPDNVEILYAHALTAENLGLEDVFERDLRRVIEIEPENAHALNALGYFLADRETRLDEAEGYLVKAIRLLPEDPAIIDSMGWLNYRQGRYEKAIVFLRKAFSKLVDPEIAAHLGEVLWVTGDEKSATEIWNKGLEQQPNDGILKGVMERYIQ